MNHPFDEFSKTVSDESVPRRESLRRMGAIIAGALLGPLALGLDAVSASPDDRLRKRRPRRRLFPPFQAKDKCTSFCNRCLTKQKKEQCLSACRACSNDPGRLKGSCGNYVCCGAGQSYCKGSCVDVKNDPLNCGSCGKTCPGGQQCVNGRCREVACPPGQSKCGNACVDLDSDLNNCGACGNVCDAGTSCINGTCTGSGDGCFGGLVRCDGICRDTSQDPSNCGACGVVCDPGQNCVGGTCVDADGGGDDCPSGGTRCNGICTNVAFDTQNCGGCGIVCAAGETCSGGLCQSPF